MSLLSRLDAGGQRLFDAMLRTWDETTFREIFGFGMVVIGFVAVYKPAGSILTAEALGLSPLVHGIWYALSGYLLSRYGNRGRWHRYFYTFPMLLYIGLTLVWMGENWVRANPIVLVQYILLYVAIFKLIADDPHA